MTEAVKCDNVSMLTKKVSVLTLLRAGYLLQYALGEARDGKGAYGRGADRTYAEDHPESDQNDHT